MQKRLATGSHDYIDNYIGLLEQQIFYLTRLRNDKRKENIMKIVEIKQVACPCCKNKRLFDTTSDTEGTIITKCQVCGSIVAASIHNGRIRTEQIATQ